MRLGIIEGFLWLHLLEHVVFDKVVELLLRSLLELGTHLSVSFHLLFFLSFASTVKTGVVRSIAAQLPKFCFSFSCLSFSDANLFFAALDAVAVVRCLSLNDANPTNSRRFVTLGSR